VVIVGNLFLNYICHPLHGCHCSSCMEIGARSIFVVQNGVEEGVWWKCNWFL
jgi:hypothetical protein